MKTELRQFWEGGHSAIGIQPSAMRTFEPLCMFSSVLSTRMDSGIVGAHIPAIKESVEATQKGINN